MKLKTIILALVFLALLSTLAASLVYFYAVKGVALEKSNDMENERLVILAGHINSILSERHKILKSLAGVPEVKLALDSKKTADMERANKVLQYFQESLGIQVLYLMTADGNTNASSNFQAEDSFIGKNYSFRPYFREALENSSSVYFALGETSGKRGIYLGQSVRNHAGKVAGVLVAKESISLLQQEIEKGGNLTTVLASPEDVIFLSSNPDWLYKYLWKKDPLQQELINRTQQFGAKAVSWVGLSEAGTDLAEDQQGKLFIVHKAEIKNAPGWQIVSFYSEKILSNTIVLPLYRTTGLLTFIICSFATICIYILFRYARSDLQQRQIAEDKLKESEEMFRSVAETATDAIITFNQQGRIVFWNSSAEGIFNYSEQAAVGKPLEMLIPGDLSEIRQAEVYDGSGDEEHTIIDNTTEMTALRKNGDEFPIEMSLASWVSQEEQIFTAIIRDISVRKELERQLHEERNVLRQVIQVTSHDLRAPLLSIEGFSGILETSLQEILSALDQEKLSEELRKSLSPLVKDSCEAMVYIRESVTKMSSLLNGLSEVARIGKVELKIKPLDMNLLMANVHSTFKFRSDEQKATINISELPPCNGDAGQINQLFSNLIGNALKYSAPERPALIRVSGHREGLHSIYCVEDNGIGIPAELQEKVFDMFHQLNPQAEGQGLGLNIVHKIVERHKGKIWVKSAHGEGSSFFVCLPGGGNGSEPI